MRQENTRGNVYTLREPIRLLGLTVPVGFESDGASVLRFFWRLVFPPGDTRALRAAFIHDYIFRPHPAGWTKEEVDKLFRILLIEGGVPRFRARSAYLGVHVFGRSSWQDN